MIRLFAGYDPRETVGYCVFVSSVLEHASEPVMICGMRDLEQRDGSNAFSYARFRVPIVCEFKGWALFMDGSDQLVLGDLAELWALRDSRYAVQVVKHSYKTRHPMKYMGTDMQCLNIDYDRKNWASVMLINCEAPEWQEVAASPNHDRSTLQFKGFDPARIGEVPAQWNVLIDEGMTDPNPKVLHWTAGIPAFSHYQNAPNAADWKFAYKRMVTPNV